MPKTRSFYFLIVAFFLFTVFFGFGFNFSLFDNLKNFGELAKQNEDVPEYITFESNSILFAGDVLLARDVEYMMRAYGFSYPFKNIQSVLNSSDVVVANFESAIPLEHRPTPNINTQFSVATDQLAALKETGITHASLANNHSFDYGISGLENTRAELSNSGIVAFGDPFTLSTSTVAYVEFEQNDRTIALIGINATIKYPDMEILKRVLSEAEIDTDTQIISIHWGNEYTNKHNRGQEWFAKMLADAGADIIIGHHPHVVQDIELYKDTLIFYSLGNFVFDQYFSDEVQNGLLVEIVFADEIVFAEELSFRLIPVTSIGSRTSPRLMASFERDTFLADLAQKSSPILSESILDGVILPANLFVK